MHNKKCIIKFDSFFLLFTNFFFSGKSINFKGYETKDPLKMRKYMLKKLKNSKIPKKDSCPARIYEDENTGHSVRCTNSLYQETNISILNIHHSFKDNISGSKAENINIQNNNIKIKTESIPLEETRNVTSIHQLPKSANVSRTSFKMTIIETKKKTADNELMENCQMRSISLPEKLLHIY